MDRRMRRAVVSALPVALAVLAVLMMAAAMTGCAIFSKKENNNDNTETFVKIRDARLPLVRMKSSDRIVNELEACTGGLPEGGCGVVTPVPEDGRLVAVLSGGEEPIASLSYNIADISGETPLTDAENVKLNRSDGTVTATIDVGSHIGAGDEFLLKLSVTTNSGCKADYFTRVRSGDVHFAELYDFVQGFHDASFSKDALQPYAKYLETDPSGSRSSLAEVDIKASTTQISWGQLGAEPKGDARYSLLQADGSFASFVVEYEAAALCENDIERTFCARDFLCVQYTSDRLYLMAYKKTVQEVFDPEGSISRKGITLGMAPAYTVSELRSENGRWVAFVSCGELWLYDTVSGTIKQVFSYKNSEGQYIGDYGINIRSVEDNGDVEYFVYGRMGAGLHEGLYGLASCRYCKEEDGIRETFFVKSGLPAGIAAQDIGSLSGTSEGRSWFLYGDDIWSVDADGTVSALVEDVSSKTLVVNDTGSAVAWNEGGDQNCPAQIRIWYLDSNTYRDIVADEESYVIAEGFVGDELIYSIGRKSDVGVMDGQVVRPRFALVATARDGEEVSRHESPGIWYSDVRVDGANVHLAMVSREAEGFVSAGSDILVRSGYKNPKDSSGLIVKTLELRREVMYIELNLAGNQPELKRETVSMLMEAEPVADISEANKIEGWLAYSFGRLEGIHNTMGSAIAAVGADMGYVTDGKGSCAWRRASRFSASVDLPAEEAARIAEAFLSRGAEVFFEENPEYHAYDLENCTVRQAVYFLGEGKTVSMLTVNGECFFITGCDAWNIYLLNPADGQTVKVGFGDAQDRFEGSQFWTFWKAAA